MCTSPIHIRNNSFLRDPNAPVSYMVPCGHCPECLKKYREFYELRAFKEYELCKKYWPEASRFFLTLTYNNDCVPFYLDDHHKRKYCADFSDVQKMLKMLRKIIKCGIRYLAVVEFGDKYGRIHYHLFLITEKYFDVSYLTYIIYNKCWIKYVNKVPDPSLPAYWMQTKNGPQYIPAGSRGFVKNIAIKRDGSIRKDYNCVRYIVKYITKYDDSRHFTKSQSLRLRSSLGFGLGPCHEVPFTQEELVRSFVFLPYSQTNRYYIPKIYYNSMTLSYSEMKKNARYVDYVKFIDSQLDSIRSLGTCYNNEWTVNEDIKIYLRSKRFSSFELQELQFERLVTSYKRIISQIPNLYLTNFFKDYFEGIDTISLIRSIADKFTEDDLLDCMLYVLPFLDRKQDGSYLSTGKYVSDPDIYSDVVFLFNCLNNYIRYNQALNHELSVMAQKQDESKSNYFKKLDHEQKNLARARESSRRKLWPFEFRRSSYTRRRIGDKKFKVNLLSVDCPF